MRQIEAKQVETRLSSLATAHNHACDFVEVLIVPQRLDRQGLALGNLLLMIELSGSIILLENARRPVGVHSLLRTLFEALVHIKSLEAEPSYVNQLFFDYHHERLKIVREENTAVRMLGPILQQSPVIAQRQSHRTEIEELKAEGFGNKPLDQRCRAVGLEEFYDMLYRSLSLETHPGIQAILTSQFDQQANKFLLYSRETTSDHLLEAAAEFLCAAVEAVDSIHNQVEAA